MQKERDRRLLHISLKFRRKHETLYQSPQRANGRGSRLPDISKFASSALNRSAGRDPRGTSIILQSAAMNSGDYWSGHSNLGLFTVIPDDATNNPTPKSTFVNGSIVPTELSVNRNYVLTEV